MRDIRSPVDRHTVLQNRCVYQMLHHSLTNISFSLIHIVHSLQEEQVMVEEKTEDVHLPLKSIEQVIAASWLFSLLLKSVQSF